MRRSDKEWQALLEEQSRSGLSKKDFCGRYGLAESTFSYWKTKLQRETGGESRARFIPIVREERPIEIVTRSGAVVRVNTGHDLSAVARLVEALNAAHT